MGQYARLISRHSQSCTVQHRVPVMPQLKRARMRRLSPCISENALEQVAAPRSLNSKKWPSRFSLMPTTFYVLFIWKPCLIYNSLTNSKSRKSWIYNIFSTEVPLPGNAPQSEIRGLYTGDVWVFPRFLSRRSAQFHQPELGINQKILHYPRTAGNVSRFHPTTPR